MVKNWILAAACAASASAFAQSSVTIFGVVDAGIGKIISSGRGQATGLLNGGNSTSRIGFRGREDLGSGLNASFWLEGELQNDVGNASGLNFQRRSTVSLSGDFGEVRLGRDYVPHYLILNTFEVYSQRGMGAVESYGPGAGAITTGGSPLSYSRTNNGVGYFLPSNLGGFYGNLSYGFGERNSDTVKTATNSDKQGNVLGGRIGYSKGALNVAGAYVRFFDVSRNAAYVDDYNIMSFGASWDFGFVKPSLLTQSERMDGQGATSAYRWNVYVLGATAPIGSGVARASLARYENNTASIASAGATKLALGYTYSLSKRTALYADVVRLENRANSTFGIGGIGGSISGAMAPVAGGHSTGVDVGIRHTF